MRFYLSVCMDGWIGRWKVEQELKDRTITIRKRPAFEWKRVGCQVCN